MAGASWTLVCLGWGRDPVLARTKFYLATCRPFKVKGDFVLTFHVFFLKCNRP